MSRKIDMDKKLSKDDKIYLAQRAMLPASVASEDEQRELLNLSQGSPLEFAVNTGDVNLAGLSIEQLEAELAERKGVQEDVDTSKLMRPEGVEAALAPEEVKPYNEWGKVDLIVEIQARNEGLVEELQMPIGGNKNELVDRLTADDEKE